MAPGLQTLGQPVAHRNSTHSFALDNSFRFIDGMTRFRGLANLGVGYLDGGFRKWLRQCQKAGAFAPAFWHCFCLVAEEQDASGLVFSHFAYRPVEELIVVEIYLEECRTLRNAARDQCFG